MNAYCNKGPAHCCGPGLIGPLPAGELLTGPAPPPGIGEGALVGAPPGAGISPGVSPGAPGAFGCMPGIDGLAFHGHGVGVLRGRRSCFALSAKRRFGPGRRFLRLLRALAARLLSASRWRRSRCHPPPAGRARSPRRPGAWFRCAPVRPRGNAGTAHRRVDCPYIQSSDSTPPCASRNFFSGRPSAAITISWFIPTSALCASTAARIFGGSVSAYASVGDFTEKSSTGASSERTSAALISGTNFLNVSVNTDPGAVSFDGSIGDTAPPGGAHRNVLIPLVLLSRAAIQFERDRLSLHSHVRDLHAIAYVRRRPVLKHAVAQYRIALFELAVRGQGQSFFARAESASWYMRTPLPCCESAPAWSCCPAADSARRCPSPSSAAPTYSPCAFVSGTSPTTNTSAFSCLPSAPGLFCASAAVCPAATMVKTAAMPEPDNGQVRGAYP